MRIAFIVDADSALVRNWIRSVTEFHCDIVVFSSRKLLPRMVRLTSDQPALGAHGRLTRENVRRQVSRRLRSSAKRLALRAIARGGPLARVRQAMKIQRTRVQVRSIQKALNHYQPDVVHAMRIPFEGVLAARLSVECPLLVSVWGNDFTLHAARSNHMAKWTARTLSRADALHADCNRDIRLARELGYVNGANWVLPSGGGVDEQLFRPASQLKAGLRLAFGLSGHDTVVLNARGLRAYIDNDLFISSAIELCSLEERLSFVGVGLAEDGRLSRRVTQSGFDDRIKLTGRLSQQRLSEMMQMADIMVSPSSHDGTPNSFLEGLATGLYPVCSDLESISEWYALGVQGELFGLTRAGLNSAVRRAAALGNTERAKAAEANRALVVSHAGKSAIVGRMADMYSEVAASGRRV